MATTLSQAQQAAQDCDECSSLLVAVNNDIVSATTRLAFWTAANPANNIAQLNADLVVLNARVASLNSQIAADQAIVAAWNAANPTQLVTY